MGGCNLDLINMCCWTHGVDIDEADYMECRCSVGQMEDEDDDEDWNWWDDEE